MRKLNPETARWARDLWDQALVSEQGIKVAYANKSAAMAARFALYAARNADRELSKTIHQEGAAEYGRSPYDTFRATLSEGKEGRWNLILQRHDSPTVQALSIEEL